MPSDFGNCRATHGPLNSNKNTQDVSVTFRESALAQSLREVEMHGIRSSETRVQCRTPSKQIIGVNKCVKQFALFRLVRHVIRVFPVAGHE